MQNVNPYVIFPISPAACKVRLVLPTVHLVDESSSKYFWRKFKKSNAFFSARLYFSSSEQTSTLTPPLHWLLFALRCFWNHLCVTGSFSSETGSNVLVEYATVAVATRNKTCLAKTTVISLERLTNGRDKRFGESSCKKFSSKTLVIFRIYFFYLSWSQELWTENPHI